MNFKSIFYIFSCIFRDGSKKYPPLLQRAELAVRPRQNCSTIWQTRYECCQRHPSFLFKGVKMRGFQGSKWMRQWPINLIKSLIVIHKITPSVD